MRGTGVNFLEVQGLFEDGKVFGILDSQVTFSKFYFCRGAEGGIIPGVARFISPSYLVGE